MAADLRPGDVVTPVNSTGEGERTLRIARVDTAGGINTVSTNAATGQSSYIFDYQTQTALLETGLTKGSITDGDYTNLLRMRPFVFQKDYQNGEMTIDTPRTSMKSIADESFFVFRTFNNLSLIHI